MRRLAPTFLLLLFAGAAPLRAQAPVPEFAVEASVSSPDAIAHALRAEANDWADTPHSLGGNSRSGIDCSSLMQNWYASLFGIDLPRTSREQYAMGSTVHREELRPGDLVFFGSKRRITHVGTYVGDGEFAHVSSSAGVTVSRLDESYWRRRFQGARRVLPDAGTTIADASTPSTRNVAGASEPTLPASSTAAPTFTGASVRGAARPVSSRRTGW